MSSRINVILAALFYMIALYFSYGQYLYQAWDYFGFTYRPWGWVESIFAVGLIVWGAALMPIRLDKPSSLIVTALYLIVYVPAVVVTLSLDVSRIEIYGWILVALGIGFGVICFGAKIKVYVDWRFFRLSWQNFRVAMVVAWVLCAAILFYFYGSTMKFVGLDETYIQRFAGRDIDVPGINYIQSIFINGICSFFMAYGLVCRKWGGFFLGAIGCVILYAITASKFAAALPLIFLALNFVLVRAGRLGFKIWQGIFLFGLITIICSLSFNQSTFLRLVAALFVFRTLAIPGLTLSQYYDLFSSDGFTWWSHVKGFSLVVSTPPSYLNDPLWPNLGLFIGERVYGVTDLNVNANLWSSDGVAAAGALGIILISLVLTVWLNLLDQSGRAWNKRFVMLGLLPYTLSLTNASFFTTLLSFGGLFWFCIFSFIRKDGLWPATLCDDRCLGKNRK